MFSKGVEKNKNALKYFLQKGVKM